MPKFLGNFDAIWEERKWELELGLGYFESYDFAGKSLAEIGQYMRDARTFQRRAWEIHFEIMYPLLAIYLQLYGLCAGNGIDPGNIAKMLQGRDSQDHGDRPGDVGPGRRGQAPRHRRALRRTSPTQIRDALATAGGNASIWLTKFDDFLKVYGWRTEGIADINIPSWIEDQTSPLGQIRNFVDGRAPRLRAGAGRRAPSSATRRSTTPARSSAARRSAAFNELLGDLHQVANFAWWNEDHNYYIDLRASIPMRRGALAAADGRRRRHATTTRLFLFFPELHRGVPRARRRGRTCSRSPRPATSTTTTTRNRGRRCRRSSARCPTRSTTRCSSRSSACTSHYFEGLKADAHTDAADGLPGVGRHATPAGLGSWSRRRSCSTSRRARSWSREATSPNWTPAFAIIGALRVRRRWLADPRRHRQPRVRHPVRRRHVGGHAADQDRRPHRGRRHARASSRSWSAPGVRVTG